MIKKDALFIDGCWDTTARRSLNVANPFTEKTFAQIPLATQDDVDRSVKAARAAFDSWAAQPMAFRLRCLEEIRSGLEKRQDEIAELISREVGTPIKMARRIQAALPVAVMGSLVGLAEEYPFERRLDNSTIIKEPVGVVACITPWNYPLHQIVAKVAPALLAGCSVILKPSELAPLNAFVLAEIIAESSLPEGVFNLVCGDGRIGECLAGHPDVDMVSFTGSVAVGKHIAEVCAHDIKRVALELGGKSASVVLNDADLPKAVKATLNSCFLNSGQTCNALTRLLIPASCYDEVVALITQIVGGFKLGDPLCDETKMGPVISACQQERICKLIEAGVREGAEVICGGVERPTSVEQGFFVAPTVLGRVTPDMSVAQKEIFGPVLCLMTYESEAEAVAMANDSCYGLGGAVWSADGERALRIARALRTGQVDINGAAFNLKAPFGGYKQSGYGRELGSFGLGEFLETKSIQI